MSKANKFTKRLAARTTFSMRPVPKPKMLENLKISYLGLEIERNFSSFLRRLWDKFKGPKHALGAFKFKGASTYSPIPLRV